MRLSNKLLGQGYVKERLKSSLRKFYGRYGDLTKQYEVPLPNVTRHFGWWPHTVTPSIDRTLHQFLTITDLDLITEFDFFYLIVQGFHRTYATGVACQQRTLTLRTPGPVPLLGLACVLMSRPISLLNLSCLRTFEFRTPLGTSLLLRSIYYLWLSYEVKTLIKMQRVYQVC